MARELARATPEEVLQVARAAWQAHPAGESLSDASRTRINLVVSTLLRRLRLDGEAFRDAGLQIPPWPARGQAIEASRIRSVGLSQRFQRPGLGVPLSLELPALPSAGRAAKHPPEGHFEPATAVLSFDSLDCPVLSLVDPRRFDSISFGGTSSQLAADFTAPYARLLGRAHLFLEGRLGVFEPFSQERQGVFLLEAYDPGKTPLVMLHGLGSSPIAWRELTNTVFGTPELSRRFQVWHYYYPTGAPYLWAGREFRETLDAALLELRAGSADVSNRDVVLVGHSMGGLLAKTAVSNSGYRLWDLVFRVRPEELAVGDEDREALRRVFITERLPYVTRVVFAMTPHRGSEVAKGWLAGIGTALIALPGRFSELVRRVFASDAERVRPAFRELFRRGGPSSVQALRSDHPLFPTLADVPLDPAVRFHSIIGDIGDGSDGVVTRQSAYLEGAASTEVVAVGHQDLEDPRVTEAIARILREHAATDPLDAGERSYVPAGCAAMPARAGDARPTARDARNR